MHTPLKSKLLGNSKAKVNLEDGIGFTPLDHAAKYGHEEVVNKLLRNFG